MMHIVRKLMIIFLCSVSLGTYLQAKNNEWKVDIFHQRTANIIDQCSKHFTGKVWLLDEKEIDDSLSNAKKYAQEQYFYKVSKFDMRQTLEQIKEKIEQEKEFYKQRIHKKRDRDALIGGSLFTLAGMVGIGITYAIYKYWHKASNDEYEQIIKELQKEGVEVYQTSQTFGNTIHTTIHLDKARFLTAIQEKLLNSCGDRLVELTYKTDRALYAEIISAGISCPALFIGLVSFLYGLSPKYKERYEKLCRISDQIEQHIQSLSTTK